MSTQSKIEWTDVTWNPVTGCNKISAGCKNCYAETMHKRLKGMGQIKYQRDFNQGPVTWEESLMEPFKWKKPRRVFVNSMSDLFHEDVSFWFIDKVFAVMASTPQHTYQILTKRADIMERWFNHYRDTGFVNEGMQGNERIRYLAWHKFGQKLPYENWQWPLPNVWIGVSVENQELANYRLPFLNLIPAAVKFVSAEPLLGSIDFEQALGDSLKWHAGGLKNCISWVIAGGESGHDARPMHPDWVRSLRDQCKEANVPFFFKQWGEWINIVGATIYLEKDYITVNNRNIKINTDFKKYDLFKSLMAQKGYYKVGTKKAGRFLDGVEHNAFPYVKCQGKCGMNYCDENGCVDRKRYLVDEDMDALKNPLQ